MGPTADSSGNLARPSAQKMAANGQSVGGIDDNLFPSAVKFTSRGGDNHTQGPSAALNYTHHNTCSRSFPGQLLCCWNLSRRSGAGSCMSQSDRMYRVILSEISRSPVAIDLSSGEGIQSSLHCAKWRGGCKRTRYVSGPFYPWTSPR